MSLRQYLDKLNTDIIPEVRKAPKLLHYSIKPVKDIVEHRVALALSEIKYKTAKDINWSNTRATAVKMVEDQLSTLKFSDYEKEEVTVLARKKALKEALFDNYGGKDQQKSLFIHCPWLAPKPPFLTRLKQAVKAFWLTAFPQ